MVNSPMEQTSTSTAESGGSNEPLPLKHDRAAAGAGNRRTKAHWRPSEDQRLRQIVAEHGTRNWNAISEKLGGGRSGKSCRLRWHNQLDPEINRRAFTEEDEKLLLAAQSEHGNKWALIADRYFPGRTDNAIKNHWHVMMARRSRRHVLCNLPVDTRSQTLVMQEGDESTGSLAGTFTSSQLYLGRQVLHPDTMNNLTRQMLPFLVQDSVTMPFRDPMGLLKHERNGGMSSTSNSPYLRFTPATYQNNAYHMVMPFYQGRGEVVESISQSQIHPGHQNSILRVSDRVTVLKARDHSCKDPILQGPFNQIRQLSFKETTQLHPQHEQEQRKDVQLIDFLGLGKDLLDS